MKEADIKIVSSGSTDQNHEHLYWVPIEKLKYIALVPKFLKTSLENIPNEITHIWSYEKILVYRAAKLLQIMWFSINILKTLFRKGSKFKMAGVLIYTASGDSEGSLGGW